MLYGAHIARLMLVPCIALAGCAGKTPAPAGPQQVAVLPLDAVGQPAEKNEQHARHSIARHLSRAGAEVIEPHRVDDALGRTDSCAGRKQFLEECAVSIGGRLKASHVVNGGLGALGKTFLIQLKVIDVNKKAVSRSLEESHFGGAARLDQAIGNMVDRLFDRPVVTPWYKRWWVWTLAGAAVISAVVVPLAMQEDDPYEDVSLP